MEVHDTTFSELSDDVILKIFTLLEDDPRNWARLSSVSTKFHSLISSTCYKSKCIASLSSDLLSLSSSDGWPSLFKLSVCCPGLLHSGVLLDNSDFGLHRELGVGVDVHRSDDFTAFSSSSSSSSSSQIHPHHHHLDDRNSNNHGDADDGGNNNNNNSNLFEGWSLYDDLYLDTIYDNSESCATPVAELTAGAVNFNAEFVASNNRNDEGDDSENDSKRRKVVSDNDSGGNDDGGGEVVARRLQRSHLASGAWNLSREQGMKLLGSRFRGDCLYISDWPGCVHGEDKRKYMLFRGVFSDFKRTRVWRTIKDGNHRSKTELNCAFCRCNETWDLHSAFCLKRGFGFHDDGEPVVRAYVCENGHVSGAWTDFPLFT